MRGRISLALAWVLLLTSCADGRQEKSWEPEQLFAAIQAEVALPEMVEVADDFLEANTGIGPEACQSAVYYLLEEGLSPDELIIVQAKDEAAAEECLEKLKARLAYKEKSAQLYLTEYLPMIQSGVVRRDGLTVSLIVSESVDQIQEVYDES